MNEKPPRPDIIVAASQNIREFCEARFPGVEIVESAVKADILGKVVAGKLPQRLIPYTKKYLFVDMGDDPPRMILLEFKQTNANRRQTFL